MELIERSQREWAKAKEAAARQMMVQGNRQYADALMQCAMFKGTESLEEMIGLMFTPRGIEFMTTFGFPGIDLMREYRGYEAEGQGVYIDAGKITLMNPDRAILAGDTLATIVVDAETPKLVRVVALHGAHVKIHAFGYNVIRVESDKASTVEVVAEDFAKVLR